MSATGIHGIGIYLPEEIRRNDYWSPELVAGWRDAQVWDSEREQRSLGAYDSEGARRCMVEMAKIAGDPFQGMRERRVMSADMSAAEMEARAAEDALARAGVRPDQIDFLLGFTFTPDYLNVPSPCIVHQRLGLRPDCYTTTVDSVCNSFQTQLALAERMIAGGARFGLLIQSSAIWRTTPKEAAFSVHFGDGATAEVVGPVSEGRGLLAQVHRTNGSLHRALVSTVPGKAWWEDGRIVTCTLDRAAARDLFLMLPDRAKEVVGEALGKAGFAPAEVGYFASHQPTIWFRRLAQEYIGMTGARAVDSFEWAGTLSAANVPLVLAIGERDGLLRDGDLVAMFSGGTGITYSGGVLRWGR